MRVLRIHSAAQAALAVLERDGDRDHLVSGTSAAPKGADAERAVTAPGADRPAPVDVEVSQVSVNPATGLVLATLLGRRLQAWERIGLLTTAALPRTTWQSTILTGLWDRRWDRSPRKRVARLCTWTRSRSSWLRTGPARRGIATWTLPRALTSRAQ